ncbi:MAG: repair protein RadA [Bacteroidota bacterium]|jgi:DNA repair protein RadA/Sms|nr:DNA repair protein RadA [Chitinophagales bacterium]
MAKTKSTFVCQSCGTTHPKWVGKCNGCGEWNTVVEEILEREDKPFNYKSGKQSKAATPSLKPLKEVEAGEQSRLLTPDAELNRVLGGGIVPGSLVLVAGEPGIGKSTLFLQLALQLNGRTVVYVSGEESEQQIKLRADRIHTNHDVLVMTETCTQRIFAALNELSPDIVIIDSIQTLYSELIESTPGSVSQIRECTGEWQRYAKENNVPVFLIGHITKDGTIAGPKVLEHMVDTVLQFEGDQHYTYRILRTLKNRFGSTAELGIYEMMQNGLRQVSNPSEILITQREEPLSGISIAATMEGMRTMLIETQALVSPSHYSTPQRTATGFDAKRLNMLLAVLEKRGGFSFGNKDVFVNLAGGLRIEDPALDLAVACALLSSFEDKPLPSNMCFVGEVGLSGEVRAVNRIDQRIAEADKLGFEKIVISTYNSKGLDLSRYQLEVIAVSKLESVYRLLF